tara:strand:- start:49 stop:471 length:423 start_codon:yes stop_codon:yes gene_type:complete
MAKDFNQVTVLGRLTRDPELTTFDSGATKCVVGLACNRDWKTDKGEGSDVLYLDCEAWSKRAEVIAEHLKKGQRVLLQGRLVLNQWQDKETGANRSKHFMAIDDIYFQPKTNGTGATQTEDGTDDDVSFDPDSFSNEESF